ncbi:MAG TPA: ABC transporter substrate-binding protein [Stellaceae bacterium]|jgi:NitT/TauT family transport system substrate-binding protein|nr:ABC transporter substrate-binding protein [Stellaceae bacterium]
MSGVFARVVAAVFALALGSTIGAMPASAAPKVTLLFTQGANNLGAYVAKDRGFFDKHGLDVDVTSTPNGSLISASLVADAAQIGTLTPSILLEADEQGLDIVAIAGMTTYPTNSPAAIMARTGSGVKTAQDLVGRKVGVPGLGGALDVLARNWVKTSGVDYHKVNWVEVQFPQMVDGLTTGLVDAVVTAEPFNTRIKAVNAGYFLAEAEGPKGTTTLIYAATREWTKKNPDALKNFRAAIEDAYVFARNTANATAVKESIAKYTKLPPAAMASIVIPDTLQEKVTGPSLAFWVNVARDQGMIKGNPDPASLVAP